MKTIQNSLQNLSSLYCEQNSLFPGWIRTSFHSFLLRNWNSKIEGPFYTQILPNGRRNDGTWLCAIKAKLRRHYPVIRERWRWINLPKTLQLDSIFTIKAKEMRSWVAFEPLRLSWDTVYERKEICRKVLPDSPFRLLRLHTPYSSPIRDRTWISTAVRLIAAIYLSIISSALLNQATELHPKQINLHRWNPPTPLESLKTFVPTTGRQNTPTWIFFGVISKNSIYYPFMREEFIHFL